MLSEQERRAFDMLVQPLATDPALTRLEKRVGAGGRRFGRGAGRVRAGRWSRLVSWAERRWDERRRAEGC